MQQLVRMLGVDPVEIQKQAGEFLAGVKSTLANIDARLSSLQQQQDAMAVALQEVQHNVRTQCFAAATHDGSIAIVAQQQSGAAGAVAGAECNGTDAERTAAVALDHLRNRTADA